MQAKNVPMQIQIPRKDGGLLPCIQCRTNKGKTEEKTLKLTSINFAYMRLRDLQRIARVAMAHCSREAMFEVVRPHYVKTNQANFLLCYVKFIPFNICKNYG